MSAAREREVQEYQQRQLIEARSLLAEARGILDARREASEQADPLPCIFMPVEAELLDKLEAIKGVSLFPPRKDGQ